MIHTNRCKRCGKPESEHLWENEYYCNPQSHVDKRKFLDSGLAALDAHKEELYEACMERKAAEIKSLHDRIDAERKIFSILNQIEKEK